MLALQLAGAVDNNLETAVNVDLSADEVQGGSVRDVSLRLLTSSTPRVTVSSDAVAPEGRRQWILEEEGWLYSGLSRNYQTIETKLLPPEEFNSRLGLSLKCGGAEQSSAYAIRDQLSDCSIEFSGDNVDAFIYGYFVLGHARPDAQPAAQFPAVGSRLYDRNNGLILLDGGNTYRAQWPLNLNHVDRFESTTPTTTTETYYSASTSTATVDGVYIGKIDDINLPTTPLASVANEVLHVWVLALNRDCLLYTSDAADE